MASDDHTRPRRSGGIGARETGFIGLGRMGGNMVSRMLATKKIRARVWDRSGEKVRAMERRGALGSSGREELVSGLEERPRVVFMMLPAGEATEETFQALLALLEPDDVIIDGGNSNWRDTTRRYGEASGRGIHLLDAGISGGVIAAGRGYPVMVGGEEKIYRYCLPIFESFGLPGGTGLVGDGGSGHYAKMVHNAIEYGMMQAIGEGFDLLANGSKKELDIPKIARIWNHGTVVSSFLMEMTARVLQKDHTLAGVAPFVEDTGEGRWCVHDAIANAVPFVANTYALNARFQSRETDSFALRLLAGLRKEFGGHPVKPPATPDSDRTS